MEADRKNAEIKWQRLLISIPVPTRWPLCPYMETYPARPASDGKKSQSGNCQAIYPFSASDIAIFLAGNPLGANARIWRLFQTVDNHPFEIH